MTRIYHQDLFSPTGLGRRTFGPLERFDHHTPPYAAPTVDPEGRSVLYLGFNVGVCGAEVFGDPREAAICAFYRAVVALPTSPVTLQELVGPPVMAIGAVIGLGTGDVARPDSQGWARAIYEDHPAGLPVEGVHYRAAHDGGEAVAIWDRAPDLVVAQHPEGMVADVALTYPPVWRRFLVEMHRRNILVRRVEAASCTRCQTAAAAAGASST